MFTKEILVEKAEKKSLEELQILSKLVFSSDRAQTLIHIAKVMSTPSLATEAASAVTSEERLVQACGWLAIIKRDYGVKCLNELLRRWSKSLQELQILSKPVFSSEHAVDLIHIAKIMSSPSLAAKAASEVTTEEELRKACRWLAVIKRDYGKKCLNETIQKMSNN